MLLFLSTECPPKVIVQEPGCLLFRAMKKYDDRRLSSPAYVPEFLGKEENDYSKEILNQRIRQTVDNLPSAEKEFIQHFYFEGMSYSEIAEETGLNLKRLQKLHLRAKRRLRTALKQLLTESKGCQN